jgi:hypothetical protein
MAGDQCVALTSELAQDGVHPKVTLVEEGFGDLTGAALKASIGDDYPTSGATPDFHTRAAALFMAAVHQYTDYRSPETDGFLELGRLMRGCGVERLGDMRWRGLVRN